VSTVLIHISERREMLNIKNWLSSLKREKAVFVFIGISAFIVCTIRFIVRGNLPSFQFIGLVAAICTIGYTDSFAFLGTKKFSNAILSLVNKPKLLFTAVLSSTLVFASAYSLAEHKNFSTALWWTIVTICTVGYGDQFPVTGAGRVVGSLTMLTFIFFLAPCVIGSILSHVMTDMHKFTDEEQKRLLHDMRETHDRTNAMMAKMETIFGEVDGAEEGIASLLQTLIATNARLDDVLGKLAVLYTEVDGVEEATAGITGRDRKIIDLLTEIRDAVKPSFAVEN
jgi:hypothetical protein